jgi:hypothetical protein
MRKDKAKVLDEVWTEDRIRNFLEVRTYDGGNEDFHMLLKAYQSMRASDFELFISFFLQQKRDLNATDKDGRSVIDVISTHRHGAQYADILKAAAG